MPILRSFVLAVLAGFLFAGPGAAQDQLYGHLRYAEAPASSLVKACIGNNTRIRKSVAPSLQAMIAAAKAEGISLRPISCFRTEHYQGWLFCRHVCDPNGRLCGKCQGRQQTEAERARVSAPGGYSEHATGYAVDFGDGNATRTDFEVAFADTAAGRWLMANAPRYGFELSYPPGNAQGVSYEPWHWRFVGTPEAKATFAEARRRYPADPAVP